MKDLATEYMKLSLPDIDRDYFNLVNIDEVENTTSRKDFYDKRLILTIEEKKIPLDDSNDWYVHDFKHKEIVDRPSRDRTVTIKIKKRRRKHKVTGQTKTSGREGMTVLAETKRPEDLLYFLKQSDG